MPSPLRILLLSCLAACGSLPTGAECWSLSGEALFPPELPPAVRAEREAALVLARAAFERTPGDLEATIWLGRRTAYLGRYREAVDIFSEGLRRHPDSPELLRHRGHRWISLREFAQAERDLARAAQLVRGKPDAVEQDGLPVAGRPPHSTLQFNVHYHLGLARFLQGDFTGASLAFLDCLETVGNDEARVAAAHWAWASLQRAGEPDGAQVVLSGIRREMDVVENTAYHRLCLLYQGELEPGQVLGGEGSSGAAAAFGVGHFHLVRGERKPAAEAFRALLSKGEWAAFGHVAAEAELGRGL